MCCDPPTAWDGRAVPGAATCDEPRCPVPPGASGLSGKARWRRARCTSTWRRRGDRRARRRARSRDPGGAAVLPRGADVDVDVDVDVDKDDAKRYREFVDEKVDDLAIAGRDAARWNGRDVIAPQDLPITKGLQEQMRVFGRLEEAGELRRLLRDSLRRPPVDVTFGEETEDVLVEVFGGISIALARSFRIVDPQVRNPSTEHWDRAFDLFRLLL